MPNRRTAIMQRFACALIATFTACALAGAAWADVYVAPKQGQSQQQFQQDQFECHSWAQQQTGFNPSQPAVVAAPPPQQGGALRGAAGGAALGAVGGAIGGDAGKGAAIGAGVGATAGLIRQNRNNRAAADATRQAQAQQQAGVQAYESAYATCLNGRGYAASR
jgi:Glycine-zipper domain